MCSLLVLLGADPEFPILVGANRDELRTRLASPPGLFVGARRRMLSPRDRRAGGTWMAVNDALWFAGLTNVVGGNRFANAASRGHLPHLALDQERLDDVGGALQAEVAARVYNDFRLLVTDGTRSLVFAHEDRVLRCSATDATTLTLSNEHALQELQVRGLEAVRVPGLPLQDRLDRLAALLLDQGTAGGHRILKIGGDYGTVSSSLVAVPRADATKLVWRYAAGPPDTTPYRAYDNLARRLR